MFVNIKKLMHPLLCKRRGGNLGSMGRGLGLGYGLIPFLFVEAERKDTKLMLYRKGRMAVKWAPYLMIFEALGKLLIFYPKFYIESSW